MHTVHLLLDFHLHVLLSSADKSLLPTLEQKLKEIEEECKRKEDQRVDLELSLMEVKENLRKAESGPVTLGTAVDTTHLENASPKVRRGLFIISTVSRVFFSKGK